MKHLEVFYATGNTLGDLEERVNAFLLEKNKPNKFPWQIMGPIVPIVRNNTMFFVQSLVQIST